MQGATGGPLAGFAAVGSWAARKGMGRAADSLERPRLPLEPKSRPPRRENSEFSHRGFGETGSRTRLSLRNNASRNRGTRDLPFRADRDGLEHAPAAVPLASTPRALGPSAVRTPGCRELFDKYQRTVVFPRNTDGRDVPPAKNIR